MELDEILIRKIDLCGGMRIDQEARSVVLGDSSMLNAVTLIGRLGKEPELRSTQSGAAMCGLSVATTNTWYDKEADEKKEETEWHRVVVWGKLAEVCHRYLEKGRLVAVTGRIQTRKYQDKATGDDRWSTQIIAKEVKFLGGKGDGQGSAKGSSKGSQGGQKQGSGDDFYENDIPF